MCTFSDLCVGIFSIGLVGEDFRYHLRCATALCIIGAKRKIDASDEGQKKYYTSADLLSDKVDDLLDALNLVCCCSSTEMIEFLMTL